MAIHPEGQLLLKSAFVELKPLRPALLGECSQGRNAVVHVIIKASWHFSLLQILAKYQECFFCTYFCLPALDKYISYSQAEGNVIIFKIKGHTSLASFPLVALSLFLTPNLNLGGYLKQAAAGDVEEQPCI